jgi:hypothetical protein
MLDPAIPGISKWDISVSGFSDAGISIPAICAEAGAMGSATVATANRRVFIV